MRLAEAKKGVYEFDRDIVRGAINSVRILNRTFMSITLGYFLCMRYYTICALLHTFNLDKP